MFESTGPHHCPECPASKRGPWLKLIVHNYSGCGVDIAKCETCGSVFQISYRVDAVTKLDPGMTADDPE